MSEDTRPESAASRSPAEPLALAVIVLAGLLASGIAPHDRLTWFFEVLPILIALPLLGGTYRRFTLTPLAYRLILLHALVLMLGAYYTYALVPPGAWVQELFELSRNHYDRLGHLMQGFVPAILARELLLRLTPLRRGGWLVALVLCVCLAISAFYELLEWWAAVAFGDSAEAFLGTQGDVWDAQWDMAMALLGAALALLCLTRLHDRHLEARFRA